MDWPLRLRPLPRFIAPFRDETITSYLARLATANQLAPAALRALLTGSDRKDAPVPLVGLAAVTGMPHAALAHAMPQICTPGELAGLHIAGRPRARDGWSFAACRHCTAGRPVTRWALHDDVVCGRHRRWISQDQTQPDLTDQLEILTAHRRHRRLIRRHGRDTVMRAFRDAHHICLRWRLDGIPDTGYGHRMEIFHGPGWRDRDDDETQTSDAAAYPQAVALTRLLATPYWRKRILGKDWPLPEEFETEVRRTVAPGYIWGIYPRTRWRRDRDDPLLEWRFRTRHLESGPLPPGHPWNLPETIQTRGGGNPCHNHAETATSLRSAGHPIP
jgi:hypothetical protein